jgi:hypothetical protein
MSEDVYMKEDHYTPELPSSLTSVDARTIGRHKGQSGSTVEAVEKAWANLVHAVEGYDLVTTIVAWVQMLSWFTVPVRKLPTQLVAGIGQYYMSAPFMGQMA